MPIYAIIFAFVIIAYGFFITTAIIGFNKLRNSISDINETNNNQDLYFSIIVSVRNEAKNIQDFLFEIEKQNFPKHKYELIIINDASEDETFNLLSAYLPTLSINYQLINQLKHAGKKQNIADGIALSKGDVIITTDADVLYRSKKWLKTISDMFNTKDISMLIMPIDFIKTRGLLALFQTLENFALMGVTASFASFKKPFLCNGANLAFTKKAYLDVNGYSNHMHISSGEDVFLLEDFKKNNSNSIFYILNRDLIVKTKPMTNMSDFLSQRIRWAYKAKYNNNKLNLFAGLLIISANLIYLVLAVAILKQSPAVSYLSIFATTKLIFDFLLLFLASDFFGKTNNLIWLLPFEFIYWLYSLFIGLASMFVKPIWKGKKVN